MDGTTGGSTTGGSSMDGTTGMEHRLLMAFLF
jgi:hypothetical protein